MKLTLTALALCAGSAAFAQEFKESDIELQSKYANSVVPHIFDDGTVQVTIDNYVYNYSLGARLQGTPALLPETPKKQLVPYYGVWNKDTETFINFGSGAEITENPDKVIFVTEKMSIDGKVREYVEFPDELKVKRNLCSFILNDKLPQTVFAHESEDGTLYGVQVFMSISDKSHPDLKKLNEDIFHTFVHLARYNPKTKEIEITNHLVDKISFPREGRNSADVSVAGVVDNKLIVVYETFTSEEGKGMYDAMGASKTKKLTFWSLDLVTKEEKQLYEYDLEFPEAAEGYAVSFDMLDQYGLMVVDCSWTEAEDVMIDGKQEKGYSSHHKLLTMSPEMQFSETVIEVPSETLLLADASPASFYYDVDAEGAMRYCNIIRSTEEARKRKDNKDHFVVYMFQVDESGAVTQEYNFAKPGVSSVDGLGIFTAKNFEEETLEKMYGNIFDPEAICKMCRPQIRNTARIVDGELITCTVQYLPEHTCGYEKCEIEKIMIRVGRIPLSE